MKRQLYEPIPGTNKVKLPMLLYGGAVVQPGQTVSVNIGGRNADDTWSDQILRTLIEDPVVDTFLGLPAGAMLLGQEFGLGHDRLWCVVRAPRRVLVPSAPDGRPGDFDVIVGRIVDGVVDLSVLGLVECKVGRALLRADGPDVRYTEWGTQQATNASSLGFDFVLLAHFLVRDPANGPERTWSSAADAADFRPEIDRMYGRLSKECGENPPFGVLFLGWGQVRGADPRLAGALTPVPMWKPPRLPRSRGSHRGEIERELRQLIPERRPAASFFRFCDRCGTKKLFSSEDARHLRCEEHRG